MKESSKMKLITLEKNYAILRLERSAQVPVWANVDSEFLSVTRTCEELTIVCEEAVVPLNFRAGVRFEDKRRILKVEGPLDFALTGILSQLLYPLAQANISVFAISTFDTDYILIHDDKFAEAIALLRSSGHVVDSVNAKEKNGSGSKSTTGRDGQKNAFGSAEIPSLGMMQQKHEAKISSWRPPVLETSRLLLRPLDESDAADIYEYAKNPNVSKYTLWEPHTSIDASLEYIREYVLPKYEQGLLEPYGIELKSNPGKIVGTVGCFWTSKQANAMELAYAISEEHWGKGIVVEASAVLMEHCFSEYKVKRLQARCKVENTQSSRVMKKLGMVYEGCLKSSILHRGHYHDMGYYAKVLK